MGITLLTFLQHHYPQVNVSQHFTSEAIERNKGYEYDENQGMVIDTTMDDTEAMDEELLGFEVHFDTNDDEAHRPIQSNDTEGMPQDDDSVSTLGAPSPTKKSTSKTTITTAPTGISDNFSISSSNSTITMESVATLQSQMAFLQSRLDNQEKATQAGFDKLASLIIKGSRVGEDNPSHPIIENNAANGGDSVGHGL